MDKVLECQAAELFQQQRFPEAIQTYTQCLALVTNQLDATNTLLNRASCHVKVRAFEEALNDCNEVLGFDPTNEKALWKRTKVLCFKGNFQEAFQLAEDWVKMCPENALATKELKRLQAVINMLSVPKPDENGENNQNTCPSTMTSVPGSVVIMNCPSCGVSYNNFPDYDKHCLTDEHKQNVNIGKDRWKCRPPPMGAKLGDITLCARYIESGGCAYADRCSQAHSEDELSEWKAQLKG